MITEQQHIDPRTTVAFTGHRNYRGEADERLMHTLEALYARGYRTFLSGMAVGFDLAAADAVLALRRRRADVRLIAVVPCRDQDRKFEISRRHHYYRVLESADASIILAEAYHPGCFRMRNDWLVDHASLLVAWYDGSDGGTRYTVGRALRQGRSLIHLHPATPASVQRAPELFD